MRIGIFFEVIILRKGASGSFVAVEEILDILNQFSRGCTKVITLKTPVTLCSSYVKSRSDTIHMIPGQTIILKNGLCKISSTIAVLFKEFCDCCTL